MRRLQTQSLTVLLAMLLWSSAVFGAASEHDEEQFGYLVDAQITDQFPLHQDSCSPILKAPTS